MNLDHISRRLGGMLLGVGAIYVGYSIVMPLYPVFELVVNLQLQSRPTDLKDTESRTRSYVNVECRKHGGEYRNALCAKET